MLLSFMLVSSAVAQTRALTTLSPLRSLRFVHRTTPIQSRIVRTTVSTGIYRSFMKMASSNSEVDGSLREEQTGMRRSSKGKEVLPSDVEDMLQRLYGMPSPPLVCLSTTGAGGQALAWLLSVPGASSVLLEATIPYSYASSNDWMTAVNTPSHSNATTTTGSPSAFPFPQCSQEAALALSRRAHQRAMELEMAAGGGGLNTAFTGAAARTVGIGCTAAVVSGRPKKGEHRCYVAACTINGTACYSLKLAKGTRDRVGEDNVVSRVIIRAILEAANLDLPDEFLEQELILENNIEKKSDNSNIEYEIIPIPDIKPAPDAVSSLLKGTVERLLVLPPTAALPRKNSNFDDIQEENSINTLIKDICIDKNMQKVGIRGNNVQTEGHEEPSKASSSSTTSTLGTPPLFIPHLPVPLPAVVLPGSFNPLHEGHRELARAGQRCLARALGLAGGADAVTAVFELSVANADKGDLPEANVLERLVQFWEEERAVVALTRAPLFINKARLFPGCAFVVGADTAKRILDPKYYADGSAAEMVAALSEMRHLGCRIIVGGRVEQDPGGHGASFMTLQEVLAKAALPTSLQSMFLGLEETDFRMDVSSTQIRNAKMRKYRHSLS